MQKPTEAEVKQLFKLDEERRELDRRSRLLEKEAEPLRTKIFRFVNEDGGIKRTKLLAGFVLSIKQRAGRVAWKDEFVQVAGSDKALELMKECPPVEYLDVQEQG